MYKERYVSSTVTEEYSAVLTSMGDIESENPASPLLPPPRLSRQRNHPASGTFYFRLLKTSRPLSSRLWKIFLSYIIDEIL